jgi:hypothetical protein
MIELTLEQQLAVDEANGSPALVIDQRTKQTFVLVRSEIYERLARCTLATSSGIPEMSEGIRRSKTALRRDLPDLLADRCNRGKYVCYHRDERIGISDDYFGLIRQCVDRNLAEDEYIVEEIFPGAGREEEVEIETPNV